MMESPKIVGICGSLRDESTTRVALTHTLAAAEAAGAETELLDLREFDLPIYDGDRKNAGDAPELCARVRDADGIVLGTPIYHGTISSGLKTALDYCGFDEFEGKPVGLLVVAGGRFPSPALLHLQTVCVWLRALPLPHQVGIPRVSNAVEDGELVDEKTMERTETLGEDVTEYARKLAFDPADLPTVC